MKLSDALILKAEWWITPLSNKEKSDELESMLEYDKDGGLFEVTAGRAAKVKRELSGKAYPNNFRNDAESYLCLFEAEIVKEEELAQYLVDHTNTPTNRLYQP